MTRLYQIKNLESFEGIFKVFNELRNARELFDVTIATDDYHVQAHKAILSASSPFLRQVIRNSNHDKPYIYLRGIEANDLEAIMDYIYTGETQIAGDHIQKFIERASELEIFGIATKSTAESEGTRARHENSCKKEEKQPERNILNNVRFLG